MSNIKRLKDKDGNIYPITHVDAVFDSEGKNIGDFIEKYNYFVTPEDYGYDYTANTTDKFIESLNSGFNVRLRCDKIYEINDTLYIPDNIVLYGDGGKATIRMNKEGKDCIKTSNGVLHNVKLIMVENVDPMAAIKIYGTTTSSRCHIYNVDIINANKTNNGIVFLTDVPNANISFAHIHDIYVTGTNIALLSSAMEEAYNNGIIVDSIVVRSTATLMSLDKNSNAWIVNNVQWNHSVTSKNVVEIDGSLCQVKGHFYDLGASELPSIFVKFGANSFNNKVETVAFNQEKILCVDKSTLKTNYINIDRDAMIKAMNEALSIPKTWCSGEVRNEKGYWSENIPYIRQVDNCFANIDKIAEVTTSKTVNFFNNIFNHMVADNYKPIIPIGDGEQFSFEIDLSKNDIITAQSIRLDYISLSFLYTMYPRYIKIEYRTNDAWTTLLDVKDNTSFNITLHGGRVNPLITKGDALRVTIGDPSDGSNVKILEMQGRSLSNPGTSYMSLGGGNIYGDVVFKNNGSVVICSPDGSAWRLTVDNTGNITAVKI